MRMLLKKDVRKRNQKQKDQTKTTKKKPTKKKKKKKTKCDQNPTTGGSLFLRAVFPSEYQVL